MNKPLISVIIPAFNAGHFLAEALASIRRQQYEKLEILVVDDGSTDNTDEIVMTLGADIRYFQQPNAGPAAARNRGLREARGELLAFLDADDIWSGNKLQRQTAYLSSHPEVDIVYGLCRFFREDRGLNPDTFWSPKPDSALFRREIFDRVGLFNPQLLQGEDLDWFYRARELGASITVIKEVHIHYRRHQESLTRGLNTAPLVGPSILHASMQRRRKAGRGKPASLPAITILEKEDIP